MREAADAGIIPDARTYMDYREMRNKTSHTCNAAEAERVAAVADGFLSDMRFLLQTLQAHHREPD